MVRAPGGGNGANGVAMLFCGRTSASRNRRDCRPEPRWLSTTKIGVRKMFAETVCERAFAQE